jgi:hypothetical protein
MKNNSDNNNNNNNNDLEIEKHYKKYEKLTIDEFNFGNLCDDFKDIPYQFIKNSYFIKNIININRNIDNDLILSSDRNIYSIMNNNINHDIYIPIEIKLFGYNGKILSVSDNDTELYDNDYNTKYNLAMIKIGDNFIFDSCNNFYSKRSKYKSNIDLFNYGVNDEYNYLVDYCSSMKEEQIINLRKITRISDIYDGKCFLKLMKLRYEIIDHIKNYIKNMEELNEETFITDKRYSNKVINNYSDFGDFEYNMRLGIVKKIDIYGFIKL